MARMTRMEAFARKGGSKKPKKITKQEVKSFLARYIKRKAIAAGVADPTKGRFLYQWHFDGRSGGVEANTRSEARGLVKRELGVPKNRRLPVGVALFKVGVTQGRDVPEYKLASF